MYSTVKEAINPISPVISTHHSNLDCMRGEDSCGLHSLASASWVAVLIQLTRGRGMNEAKQDVWQGLKE